MTRRLRITKRTPLWLVLIVLFVTLAQQYHWFDKPKTGITTNPPGTYRVVEVYDGDTIAVDMNGKIEKIRLIGVDTPETHDPRKTVQCFGIAASEQTKQALTNQNVRLEADPTNTNRDRYNRLLRYVYLPDGRLWDAELIKNGYGFAYTSFPFEKKEEFKSLENDARTNNRGLWGGCEINDQNGRSQTNPS
jgi:micrococcal nuclease